ncbi:MAG: hypothetical protein GX446_15045 [Chthonomonadales bacterium]|nr:hypothetical protein [Chthonomonadales bacterium]
MHLRARMALMVGAASLLVIAGHASAQSPSPFTIRFPPDGAIVREKVPIRVPLASIPEGAYVAFSIDGQFRVALAPTDEQREKAKPGDMFEYLWDTKAVVKIQGTNREEAPQDGQHKITATLFVPKSGSAGGSDVAETSEITVTLENRITLDPGPISLRYRYEDGSNRTYSRTGTTAIVGGVTQGLAAVGDVELIGQSSNLLLAVEDVYENGRAIVRNRLTRLAIKQGGQETVYPSDYLPKSIYQEVDPQGVVHYPPQDRQTSDMFWQMGVPVSATLDLPILPTREVKVGDTWETPNVVLDIPGTAPEKQPRVTVTSKLVGFEWEGNHQTAKITQTYKGTPKEKSIVFGNIVVDKPTIDFKRDVYVAYRSGALIKIDRKLEVTGTTSGTVAGSVGGAPGMSAPGAPMAGGMSMPGGGAPPLMSGGMMSPPGLGSGGMTGPPMLGAGGMPMMGPGGLAGPPGASDGREGPRGGRGARTPQIGRGGSSMGLTGPPMMGSGMTGPMGGGMRGPMGGYSMGAGMMNPGQAQTNQKITLRSTTITELAQKPEAKP